MPGDLSPAHGANPVPTNLILRAIQNEWGAPVGAIDVVVERDGEEVGRVSTKVEDNRTTTADVSEVLEPLTRYTFRFVPPSDVNVFPFPPPDEYRAPVTVVTDEGVDDRGPRFAGELSVSMRRVDTEVSECGRHPAHPYILDFSYAVTDDESYVAAVEVWEQLDRDGVATRLSLAPGAPAEVRGAISPAWNAGSYWLVAVDAAGNRSRSPALHIDPSDLTFEDQTTRGALPDETPPVEDVGGCACTPPRAARWPIGALVGLLCLAGRRRSR